MEFDHSQFILLQKGILEPVFYGDFVYKFKRIVEKPTLTVKLKKMIKH